MVMNERYTDRHVNNKVIFFLGGGLGKHYVWFFMVVLFFSFTLRKLSMYLEFPGNHQGVVLAAQSQKEPSLLVVLLTANVLSG